VIGDELMESITGTTDAATIRGWHMGSSVVTFVRPRAAGPRLDAKFIASTFFDSPLQTTEQSNAHRVCQILPGSLMAGRRGTERGGRVGADEGESNCPRR